MINEVEGRFWQAQTNKVTVYQDGSQIEAVEVLLMASQGDPFGKATPNGLVRMTVVPPEVVEFFKSTTGDEEFQVIFRKREKIR